MANTPKDPNAVVVHRGGPPKGSMNAARHYLYAGQLPKSLKYIEIRMNAFRRSLESAVLAVRGEITLTDSATINSAMKWERHSCLAQRWLVKSEDTEKQLTPEQQLHFSREIAKASTERDKAIAALKLDDESKHLPWIDEPSDEQQETK